MRLNPMWGLPAVRELRMKRVRAALVALAAALAAAAVVAPPGVAAAAPDVLTGGCFLDTATDQPFANGETYGVIGDISTSRTGDTPPAPIGATVTCWIEIHGVVAPGTTHSFGDIGPAPGV